MAYGSCCPLPNPQFIPMLDNATVVLLPSSKNFLSPISHESTLAFSVSSQYSADFTESVQELGVNTQTQSADEAQSWQDEQSFGETKRWIMGSVKGDSSAVHRGFRRRVLAAWTAFVDLLKVCSSALPENATLTDLNTRMPKSLISSSCSWDICPCTLPSSPCSSRFAG